jgi:uncharacterized membrane protein
MYRPSPIPAPSDLGKYEKVLPGIADRILRMAERQQSSDIKREMINGVSGLIGILLTRGFLYALTIMAFVLVMNGKEIAGLLAGLAPIVSIFVAVFRSEQTRQ